MADAAPFYRKVAEGPETAYAVWIHAADGVRLRVALWPGGAKGTVLLFPGRTEYIEKYGRTAGDLAAQGYGTIAIDWRGQGLADRALDDCNTGHVVHFMDYQQDVAALLKVARAHSLPEPYYLLAHSMGGCIGLRALMRGLPVKAAVFTSPMWGIAIAGLLRPIAWAMSWAARATRTGHFHAPGTRTETYVKKVKFENNVLTTDRDMFDYMQRQVRAHPDLALGGPSLHWLYEALRETRNMAREPAPVTPTMTFLGTDERVVDTAPIQKRMHDWSSGRLEIVGGAKHEVLLERPATRARVMGELNAFFAKNA